jgi:hypothetical protein
LLLSPQDFARRPNGSRIVISTIFFYVECGDYGYGLIFEYGLIIDERGCVDLWTIWIWFDFLCCECECVDLWTIDYWIWFDFLMLWIKPCCECGCADYRLWAIWIWFDFLMLWIKPCCECGVCWQLTCVLNMMCWLVFWIWSQYDPYLRVK